MAKLKRVELQTIPENIKHELLNWSRWCWLGPYPHPLPPTQCESLEGNYVRKNEDGSTESVDRKPIPVCVSRALVVQGVYDVLPYIPQQVLRAEFPQHHEHKLVVSVSKEAYADALATAVYRVILAFERGGY